MQSVPISEANQNLMMQGCLSSVNFTVETDDYLVEYFKRCDRGRLTSVLCEYGFEARERAEKRAKEQAKEVPTETKPVSAVANLFKPRYTTSNILSHIPKDGNSTVYLNVYNLFQTHPILALQRCVESYFDSDALYHTSISYDGDEFYYGFDGVNTVPDGKSSFGSDRARYEIGSENLTRQEMQEHIETLADIAGYNSANYDLFTFNCNTFTNHFSLIFFGKPIHPEFQRTVTKLANTPLGTVIKTLQPMLRFFSKSV